MEVGNRRIFQYTVYNIKILQQGTGQARPYKRKFFDAQASVDKSRTGNVLPQPTLIIALLGLGEGLWLVVNVRLASENES